MELTPELFEKIEFTERRKGYDTDQVETFLEEAGTALAQLLARYRHIEERAAAAEARLSEADARIAHAEDRANRAEAHARQAAAAAVPDPSAEQAEVEQAARTLLMARRTAEAMEQEARQQAQNLLGEAKTRADRQLGEAQAEAEELIRRARVQAEQEYAERRVRAQDEVTSLEDRRAQLGDVITQLEARLAGYREDLTRTAEELTLLASDPDRLGARPNLSIPPDEVLRDAAPQVDLSAPLEEVVDTAAHTTEHRAVDPTTTWTESEGGQDAGPLAEAADVRTISLEDPEPMDATGVHDTAAEAGGRDRYMEELDSAVNEAVPTDDEAMTAFFEGSADAKNRRFGWRR